MISERQQVRARSSLRRKQARHIAQLASLLLAYSCGHAREHASVATEAIKGGEIVHPGAWPNVVWLSNGCAATLVHESVVVYAAHCGTKHDEIWLGEDFGARLDQDAGEVTFDPRRGRRIAVAQCRAHEDAEIGGGADIAYCTLRQPVHDVPIAPPAVGCERVQVEAGSAAVLVGYGLDQATGGSFGIKRAVSAEVDELGNEIVIGDGDRGTCRGDSGGPAFMRVPSRRGSHVLDWRLIGVMSSGILLSGDRDQCGTGWYTDIAKYVPWIEETANVDVTPCSTADGDQGHPIQIDKLVSSLCEAHCTKQEQLNEGERTPSGPVTS